MKPAELHDLLEIAKHVASLAAMVHHSARQKFFQVQTKCSTADLVTEIDHESERVLVEAIRKARPYDGIVGEEGTEDSATSQVCWVLDPLDGTTNFVHGYPAYSVSVGVEIEGTRALGVVHDTYHDIVFAGIVGAGASCDGRKITVRSEPDLARALIGTGFLPQREVRASQARVLGSLLPLIRDVRRSGCPSLDLCAVAAGTLDGFYEAGLGRWDIAAGTAIAEAAGASVEVFQSSLLPNPVLVVANAQLLEKMVAVLKNAGAVDL
jgi:myo-inositol-1(or 4)-monophosphatase